MNLAAPGFLGALVLLVPLVVAFLVKRQRRVVRVPSTMVWRLGARAVAKNRKLRDLRRILALVACALGVAALIVAAARPSAGSRGDTTVFVVDTSASMEGEPIASARRWLAREAAAFGPRDRVAIVTTGGAARVLVPPGAPGVLLDHGLRKLDAEPLPSALGEAIAMAEGLAGIGSARVVVLSDAPVDEEVSRRDVKPVARVFARTARDNVGIASMFTRVAPDARDEEEREANVSVATSSAKARRAKLTLTHAGLVVAERVVVVPPRGKVEERFGLRGGGRVVAKLTPADGEADALSLDDEAALTEPVRRPLRVGFVAAAEPGKSRDDDGSERERKGEISAGAFFVRRAVEAAGAEVVEIDPDESKLKSVVDVVVAFADGPGRPKDVPTFYIGAHPRELGLVPRPFHRSEGRLRTVASSDPLMRGVVLDDLTVLGERVAAPPRGARVLVELDAGPALLAGRSAAASWVWMGISPEASDLALRVAFPVLVGNVLTHLGGTTRVVSASTVPLDEVLLEAVPVKAPLPVATEPRWRLPIGLPSLLSGLAVVLLALEAWFSLIRGRGWAT